MFKNVNIQTADMAWAPCFVCRKWQFNSCQENPVGVTPSTEIIKNLTVVSGETTF